MPFFSVIDEAVQTIQSNETTRQQLAHYLGFLRSKDLSKVSPLEVGESSFAWPVDRNAVNARIAAADSGFVSKPLHSIDLVLVRAVGVLFDYQNSIVRSAQYFPSFFDFPHPFLSNHALDLAELDLSTSFLRLREEIRVARQIIVEQKPGFFLVDGSLVPQYAEKPRRDSKLSGHYELVVRDFLDLYKTAQENNTELVGCVKDSRGSRFANILRETVLPFFGAHNPPGLDGILDSVLLDHVLAPGERSFAFSYAKNISEHAILQDFGEWGKQVYACYVKPSPLDRPLRFEFMHAPSESLTEHANRVSSVLFELSSLHREFAFPSVLIEADLRARLKPHEIDIVFNRICDKLNKRLHLQLRRNSRPF